MRLFEMLRIYRAFKGYKLKELADEIGISPRELAALEGGRHDIKPPKGKALARILLWILGETKEATNG